MVRRLTFAANISWLWPEESDPYERLEAASNAGFSRVERMFVHDVDTIVLQAALDHFGLEMTLFDAYAGDWEAGERGLLTLLGREEEFSNSALNAIAAAETLDTRLINLLAGVPSAEIPSDVVWQIAVTNLTAIAPEAEKAGITLLVEAINTYDMPGYAFPTTEAALELVRAVAHPNVGIQFDTYHVGRMGGDILGELRMARNHVKHIQISDMPGRHEPGTGRLPLRKFLEEVASFYHGVIGLEYIPSGSTIEGLQWLPRVLRS